MALCAGLMTGCIEAPELERLEDRAGADNRYPSLVPLGPILASSGDPATGSADLEADLGARVAGLQRRADTLRQADVLDPVARRRLLRGVPR